MNQPKIITKEEFLEAAERENMGKEYIDSFLVLAEEVEKAGDGPFDYSIAMPVEGIEVYSFQCSKPF